MADQNVKPQMKLDPAVVELIAAMQQKQEEARLPKRVREKKARERAKMRARRDQRVTYDIPPALKQAVFDLAESLGLPASQLATWALTRFLEDYKNEQIDIARYRKPSRSPRYDWKLVFPKEWFEAEKLVGKKKV